MTPKKRLLSLRLTACKKINRLNKRAIHALTLSQTEREPVVSYIVVESLNTWNNFLRALYLSCVVQAKSTKGKKITTPAVIPSFNDAIGIAINHYRPRPMIVPSSGIWGRREEPKWHDIQVFIRSCQAISCSYIPDIQSALSIGTRVYTDLPVIRNYYAHRNNSTALKVKNLAPFYGISSSLLPTDILFSYPLSVPRPLIISILDDLYTSVEFLCEGL